MAAQEKKQGGKLIALTFDDGPGAYTNRLLDGLAARDVKVTFFVLGQCAENYDVTLNRIYKEGHQIAQHSYSHPTLSTQSDAEVRWQINHTKEIINEALGKDFNYYVRPPYGDYSSRVLLLLDAPAILWSVDPLDWKYRNAQTVRNNIVNGAFDGAIVLAHDIHSTTVDGVLMAIDDLLAEGYEFVTVRELYRRRGETLYDGELCYSCKPKGTDLGPVAAPTIEQQKYYGGYDLKMTAAGGADIYYTTDGSDPAVSGKRYTGETLSCANGTTIKACAAFDLNGGRSDTVTYIVRSNPVQAPTLSVKDEHIVFSNPNANTDIRYTTDGSAPTKDSKIYTDPIPLFRGTLRYRVMGMGISGEIEQISVSTGGCLFRDVSIDSWYFDNVMRAVELGIFTGTDVYRFDPDRGMTRAMFVTTLSRLMKMQGENTQPTQPADFSDVEDGLWYSDAVAWASEQKIVLGYDDGLFRPDKTISRQEMCVILARLLDTLQIEQEGEASSFADQSDIAPWAEASVSRVVLCGLMNGAEENRFFPCNITSRAQASTVLLRLYDLLRAE